jgi:hypothetical protein
MPLFPEHLPSMSEDELWKRIIVSTRAIDKLFNLASIIFDRKEHFLNRELQGSP